MKSQEEIDRQIEGLENMKTTLSEYSAFGTPNHQIADAQISILNGSSDKDDFEEGDWNEMDEENQIFRGVEEAQEWLDGERDEDLYE